MACDRYFELLSARLDGALTQSEERELEEHMANCPECRTVGAQLAALQAGFAGLEEISAPEGFTQGVMDRIQKQKVIPWKPRFRALAGWAACLVLVAGLYGFTQNSREQDLTPMTRGVGLDPHMGLALERTPLRLQLMRPRSRRRMPLKTDRRSFWTLPQDRHSTAYRQWKIWRCAWIRCPRGRKS